MSDIKEQEKTENEAVFDRSVLKESGPLNLNFVNEYKRYMTERGKFYIKMSDYGEEAKKKRGRRYYPSVITFQNLNLLVILTDEEEMKMVKEKKPEHIYSAIEAKNVLKLIKLGQLDGAVINYMTENKLLNKGTAEHLYLAGQSFSEVLDEVLDENETNNSEQDSVKETDSDEE